MGLQSAHLADLEPLMNTTQSTPALRHVILVTVLSVACAFCTGCHSSAQARLAAPATPSEAAPPASRWDSMAPSAPLDERPITPMESVGAAAV